MYSIGSTGLELSGDRPDRSVEREARVDGTRPLIDAAGERLCLLEALLAEPHGDVQGTGSVMADNDDGPIGVELRVSARGDVAHGHKGGARNGGGLCLPRLAHIEQKGRVGLLEQMGQGVDGDLWRKHLDRITNLPVKGRTLGSLTA